jgi:glycosyltransferase involved in cell wall biosynthesis
MIGNGRDFGKAKTLADTYQLTNIEFIKENISIDKINAYMGQSDIVLGIFGDTAKAFRVIPNKVYEGLASQRAVITMDTVVMREIFSAEHMKLVSGDPKSIADAIIDLSRDAQMRKAVAKRGYDAVSHYFPKSIAQSLVDVVTPLIKSI